jgi:hypothetical protein
MSEAVIVTTYKRPEFLFCCLKRIRALAPEIDILLCPDRGTYFEPDVWAAMKCWGARMVYMPEHTCHGNTYNTMEAFRLAYTMGYERIYLVEDDVMIHPDFFLWHRAMQEEFSDIFASMAWIFNRHAPIEEQDLFQPWYYSVGTCFARKMLAHVVEHARPEYYMDMAGYIERTFPKSTLNAPFNIQHYEQDGLIQRVLDKLNLQTVSPGIAKCSHIGYFGYNQGWDREEFFFGNALTFTDRVKRVEEFIADPYWRAARFGRPIVEREIGQALPAREFRYKIKLADGWESEFTSELEKKHLPKTLNSVPLPKNAEVVLLSS